MRLFLLILILFFMSFFLSSCSTIPKADLKNKDSKIFEIWIEKIKNKNIADDYENIYKFNNKANLNIFIYGYYSAAIKYKLFEVENGKAFYYTETTLKNYIVSSMPNLNFYNITSFEKLYSPLKQIVYFGDNFKNKKIYLVVGVELKDNILYMAKDYLTDYKKKLNLWLKNNGYLDGKEWHPVSRADWNSYPLPTKDDLDWDNIYKIGEII